MTKRQLATAQARHDKGERWYDGPELIAGVFGIGTREEIALLKADGMIPADALFAPVVPSDLA